MFSKLNILCSVNWTFLEPAWYCWNKVEQGRNWLWAVETDHSGPLLHKKYPILVIRGQNGVKPDRIRILNRSQIWIWFLPDTDPAPVQKTWLWIRLGSIMKAVPSHTFQLDLEPCHFTHGWGGDNRLLREQIDNSWDFLRELIHHTTPQAFQQIVISRR